MKSIRIANDIYLHTYLHQISLTLEESFSKSDDIDNPTFDFKESAKELIDGMDGHWCVALLEAIKKECENRIHEHREEYAPHKNIKI